MGERIRRDFAVELGDAYYQIEEQGCDRGDRVPACAHPRRPKDSRRPEAGLRHRDEDLPRPRLPPAGYLPRPLDEQHLPGGRRAPEPFELAVHFIALLFAAHTNTTGTFAWLVAELARRPELLARLRAEQDAFRARHGDGFDFQSLRQLTLLDAAMKEVVRTHFAVMLVRKAAATSTSAATRSRRATSSPSLHPRAPRSQNLRGPAEFRPDRWLDAAERRDLLRRGAYVQFGFGQHRCLGEMYANLVLKIGWSILLRGYDFELLDPELPSPTGPRPRNPVRHSTDRMRIQKR